MSGAGRATRRFGLGLLALAAATAAALAASFVLRPFWWFERLGKAALGRAGLERATLAGPRGAIAVWRGGRGPTLVLIHGANDQAGGFARIAAPLAAERRLVVFDLPGHGESAPGSGPLAIGDLAAGLATVVASEAGAGPVTLAGNSLGGYLALVHALRHPGQVAHVVLLNGAAIRAAPGVAVSLLPSNRAEAAATMEALTAAGSPRVPGYVLDDLVRRAPGSPLRRLLERPTEPELVLDERLAEIATPVTLIWGAADRYLPLAYAERVRGGLPRARLETLQACGHLPQRECPERLLAALLSALASPPG